MLIQADGVWLHEGSPILRDKLVRLFSSVLRKDADGATYLVTPAEKLEIRVEDSPFVAVEMSRDVQFGEPVLTFRTNVGDVVAADSTHPLRFAPDAGSFIPYVLVRGRLEARLTRALAFDLAQMLEEDAAGWYLRSSGARFSLPEFE
ncbi:DUF1285 domain-containing protein [Aureimonas fodinaquatilis]|uniref:DUF1285 domain-containing protein n=2 Tax=Aureimonas fodinaquatilis TaxID=2565783 RepID=A0A5B0E1Z9_9HYPH|nr:DUF1285 domain-containing protein [Aureimonas fodinaquatilis]